MSDRCLRRCLITGATGAVGPPVVRAFLAAGYAVRVLVRHSPRPDELPDSVEIFAGDILSSPLSEATRDIDVIVHLAALLHLNAPVAQSLPQYERVNVNGTRNLVAAAIESGVCRFVYFSTIAVYGPGDGRIIDESAPPVAATPYAASKLAAESIVLDAKRNGVPIGVVLRMASIYGPGVKGNYRRLIHAMHGHRYFPIGAGANRRTLIYEDDAGQAALLAAESTAVPGQVFNVTDGSHHTIAEIAGSIAGALGRRSPRVHLPINMARMAAGIVDRVAPRIHARMLLNKYCEDIAVDGSRFQRVAGFQPRVDLATGWNATIRRMKDAGKL